MDASCMPALLAVARPVLPAELVGRLMRWEALTEMEREQAKKDLELIAGVMRMAAGAR